MVISEEEEADGCYADRLARPVVLRPLFLTPEAACSFSGAPGGVGASSVAHRSKGATGSCAAQAGRDT